MSSKKILVSVSFDEEVMRKLDDESAQVRRSRSNLIDQILRERYGLHNEGLELKHANKA